MFPKHFLFYFGLLLSVAAGCSESDNVFRVCQKGIITRISYEKHDGQTGEITRSTFIENPGFVFEVEVLKGQKTKTVFWADVLGCHWDHLIWTFHAPRGVVTHITYTPDEKIFLISPIGVESCGLVELRIQLINDCGGILNEERVPIKEVCLQ